MRKTRSRKSCDTVSLTLFAFSSLSLYPSFFLLQVSFLILVCQTFSTDSSFPLLSQPERLEREGGPCRLLKLSQMETQRVQMKGVLPWLGPTAICFRYTGDRSLFSQSTYIYSVQSSVWRLPNYWPPPPLTTQRVCPPPAPKAGGTNSPGGEGVGKTPDNGLASYRRIPLRHFPSLLSWGSTRGAVIQNTEARVLPWLPSCPD